MSNHLIHNRVNNLYRLLFTISVLLLSITSANAEHKGRVFIDTNGNNLYDSGEVGVEGATVSDGLNIVKTNSRGEFNLKGWEKERFISIYPSASHNYSTRYIKIGSNSEYLFPLTKKEKRENSTFLQISDTETFEFRDWVDGLKQYTETEKPDFIVHTGDICYKSGMTWHASNLTTKDVGVPIYYCLGNHDMVAGEYGEKFFEDKFGPAWYAFESGNTLFIVTPMMHGDSTPSFSREDIGTWLKNLLSSYPKAQPKVIFNHDLLTDGDQFIFKIDESDSINFNNYNLKAWLYGHWHINMVKSHGDSNIKSYGTATIKGGIDHSPSCFRVIDVDKDGDTSSKLRWVYPDRAIAIAEPQNGVATLNSQDEVTISVNSYHTGSEVDSVKLAVWGGDGLNWNSALDSDKWQQMTQKSDWNWTASVPATAEESYDIVVDIFLKSGEILHAKENFIAKAREGGRDITDAKWGNLGGDKEHSASVDIDHNSPYTLAWSRNLGSNIFMSSPLLYKSSVITSTFDDGNAKQCYIVSIDINSGIEQWRVKTKNGVKNQMVLSDNLVIGTDVEGITYAIDITTGKLIWKRDIGHNKLPAFVSGVVSDGVNLYTGQGESLSAIDCKTGEIIWKNSAWKGGEGSTPTMTIAGSTLIASRHWGALYAHNIDTGELLWSRSDDGLRFRDGVVSYIDNYLWVAERSDSSLGKLHKIDLKSGETVMSFHTGMQNTGTSAPVVLDNRIIIASSNPGVAAFNRESGDKIWEYEVDKSILYTPSYLCDGERTVESTPIVVGNSVIFGAMDGTLYSLNIDSGKCEWKARLGAPILTSFAISEESIFICDFAGNIYRFDSK